MTKNAVCHFGRSIGLPITKYEESHHLVSAINTLLAHISVITVAQANEGVRPYGFIKNTTTHTKNPNSHISKQVQHTKKATL